MQPKKTPGTLKYWLCGDDAPSNGVWYDRVGNLNCTLYGGASYDQDNKWYDFGAVGQYGDCGNPNTINFDMGNHWQIDYDMMIQLSTTTSMWIDIASVDAAQKAVGYSIRKTSSYDLGIGYLNWKMKGNSSSSTFPSTARILQNAGIPISTLDQFVRVTGYYKTEDAGNGYDKLIFNCNGITSIGDPQLPKTEYGPTWESNKLDILIGRGVMDDSYNASIKLRDLKIYYID